MLLPGNLAQLTASPDDGMPETLEQGALGLGEHGIDVVGVLHVTFGFPRPTGNLAAAVHLGQPLNRSYDVLSAS